MKFVSEITVGNLLTAASVMVALGGLLYSQWRDREQDRALHQAEARAAAGLALAEFRRIDDEMMLFFHNVEPAYVAVSKALGEHKDVIRARDALWRKISDERAEMERRVTDGARREGFAALALASPKCHAAVERQLDDASFDRRSVVFAQLVLATQREVLGMEDELAGYTSAVLGNRLRQVHGAVLSNGFRPLAGDVGEPSATLLRLIREPGFSGDCPG